jgi:transposase
MKDFHLSDKEIAELRVAHRRCGDKRAAYRLNAVILLGSGWSAKEVSVALLIDEGTLRGYIKRFRRAGLSGCSKTSIAAG